MRRDYPRCPGRSQRPRLTHFSLVIMMTARLKRSHGLSSLLAQAAVVLLLALLALNRLGAADVCGGSEAAMAVYVQQMIERKQFVFPLDNCSIPMYKPPLYHWSASGLAVVFR